MWQVTNWSWIMRHSFIPPWEHPSGYILYEIIYFYIHVKYIIYKSHLVDQIKIRIYNATSALERTYATFFGFFSWALILDSETTGGPN